MGAPDVAMAEAGISAFTTVFFIIFLGGYYRYYSSFQRELRPNTPRKKSRYVKVFFTNTLLPLLFIAAIFVLFVYAMPTQYASYYLKHRYLGNFMQDVGGENAVAAILLGYRVYDTLFEALALVIAVVAVLHMSHFKHESVSDGEQSDIANSDMATFILRIICPLILIFGIYLIINGHISAGGGFQGGLAIATFFICRYMIYNIYDISVRKALHLEEMIFISIILLSVLAVILGAGALLPPVFQNVYLVLMNVFIGLKVACGFFVLFYRFIAVERVN
jgi:multicomponent Na+:H+ antiporter subunit B